MSTALDRRRSTAQRLYLDALAAVRADPAITPALLARDASDASRVTIADCSAWDDAYGSCDHDACEVRRVISRAHLLRATAGRLRVFTPDLALSVCVYRFCAQRGTAHAGTCPEVTS